MTIGFLTQYYRGLGHSQRIKFIAEETAKHAEVIIMDQLFRPPIQYKVPHIAFLKDYKPPTLSNMFQFIQQDLMISFRIKQFIECLEKYNITTLVCEGFPFCRHQFAHEYFTYFEECKKRNIKIIISIRDFPWDEPHSISLTDWVLHTQNTVCKYFAHTVLVHGDPNILPLISDRTRHANSKQVIDFLKEKIVYTGYVCDESVPMHSRKNNNIFISTGLNKEESFILFKAVATIAKNFPEYNFIMPVANRYRDIPSMKNKNIYLVEYVPELRNKLIDCAAYITYGGYNATVEILKSKIPSIIIPRKDGKKLEQYIRAYAFEPYGFFKVLNNSEFNLLEDTLRSVLNNEPKEFYFDLEGTTNSAKEIIKIYNE
jgi:predicted glycosyltransferase